MPGSFLNIECKDPDSGPCVCMASSLQLSRHPSPFRFVAAVVEQHAVCLGRTTAARRASGIPSCLAVMEMDVFFIERLIGVLNV